MRGLNTERASPFDLRGYLEFNLLWVSLSSGFAFSKGKEAIFVR
jgi:hypothetical protein